MAETKKEKLLSGVAMPGASNEQLLSAYYTPEQLAAELGVDKRTLARWARLGEGPPRTRIGHRLYYRKTSTAAWMLGLEEDAA
jgi:hypothetical protein